MFVNKFIQETKEEPFPEELKQILYKKYKVMLKLNAENITNACPTYEAVSLDNPVEVSAEFSPSQLENTKPQPMSITQVMYYALILTL